MKKVLFFAAALAVLAGCGGDGDGSGSPSPFAGRYVGTADVTGRGDSDVVDHIDASATGRITRDGVATFVATYPETYLRDDVLVTVTTTDTITAKVDRGALSDVLQTNASSDGNTGGRGDGRGGTLEVSGGLLTVNVLFGEEQSGFRYVFRLQKPTL